MGYLRYQDSPGEGAKQAIKMTIAVDEPIEWLLHRELAMTARATRVKGGSLLVLVHRPGPQLELLGRLFYAHSSDAQAVEQTQSEVVVYEYERHVAAMRKECVACGFELQNPGNHIAIHGASSRNGVGTIVRQGGPLRSI